MEHIKYCGKRCILTFFRRIVLIDELPYVWKIGRRSRLFFAWLMLQHPSMAKLSGAGRYWYYGKKMKVPSRVGGRRSPSQSNLWLVGEVLPAPLLCSLSLPCFLSWQAIVQCQYDINEVAWRWLLSTIYSDKYNYIILLLYHRYNHDYHE